MREAWLHASEKKKLTIPRHSSRLLLLSCISMNAEVTIGNEIVIDLIWKLAVRQIRINDQARFRFYVSAYSSSGTMLT